MNNKLTQEYKDDLYGKVLEKKRVRNIKRKKMLSIFIVFASVVGFTTLGFSLLEKEDYKNFFISETENITFNDEYEYFDDLGIKLEFINIDKNSLTLGINIKYDNIADCDLNLEQVKILDENDIILLNDDSEDCNKQYNVYFKSIDYKVINNSEKVCILKYNFENEVESTLIKVELNKIVLAEEDKERKIGINYEKQISIED